jgi:hypothetical protein
VKRWKLVCFELLKRSPRTGDFMSLKIKGSKDIQSSKSSQRRRDVAKKIFKKKLQIPIFLYIKNLWKKEDIWFLLNFLNTILELEI